MHARGSRADTAAREDGIQVSTIAGAILVFALTFLFRCLTFDFTNDHFVHLSRARQILLGDVPVKDFFDPGLFLQYYASAAALMLSGGTLLGETVLTVGGVALGTALTFLLATALTSSRSLGLAAAALTVAIIPRLYNYPKVFLYALALLCMWEYLRRPGRLSLMVLSLVTALAFLFRHDHGVYIGAAVTVGLAVFYWREWPELGAAFARYVLVVLIAILPWGVFVQSNAGLWTYFTGSIPQVREAATPRFNWLPFTMAPPTSWFRLDPAPDLTVFVRWAGTVDETTRQAKEAQYGLLRGEARDENTWRYALASDEVDRIRALVQDPAVEDTHGIDRSTFRVNLAEDLTVRLQRQIPLLRLHMAPGLMTEANAVAWLYYLTILAPFAAGVLLVVRRHRISRAETAFMTALVALCLMIDQGILRDYPGARLADVAAPTAVLLAWVVRSRQPRPPGAPATNWFIRPAAIVAVAIVTIWSAASVGRADVQLRRSGILSDPAGTPARLMATVHELQQRPIDLWSENSDSGLHELTRYVLACTAPSDRILVAWFEPEVFFYGERGFAGGQVYLYKGWHSSDADQRLTVERMRKQRVPIVLVNSALEGNPFKFDFPIVYQYVVERYRVAAEGTFGFDQTYSVLTDRHIVPTGTYDRFDLPCYR